MIIKKTEKHVFVFIKKVGNRISKHFHLLVMYCELGGGGGFAFLCSLISPQHWLFNVVC